jgi:hypothetical protein
VPFIVARFALRQAQGEEEVLKKHGQRGQCSLI